MSPSEQRSADVSGMDRGSQPAHLSEADLGMPEDLAGIDRLVRELLPVVPALHAGRLGDLVAVAQERCPGRRCLTLTPGGRLCAFCRRGRA